MNVSRISTLEELEPLGEAWNRLAGGVPFRTHQWLHTWFRYYGGDHGLFVLAMHDDAGTLRGVAPWCLRMSAARGRVLKPLGSGEVCSDYLTILAGADDEGIVAGQLADYLIDDGAGEWDLIDLDGVDPSDSATRSLVAALAERGHRVHCRDSHRCWRIELPESWLAYTSMVSKSHRKLLRRLHTRELESGRARFHLVQTSDELAYAWELLVDLHQLRRNSLGEPGCFASPRFTSFHHEACRQLLAGGMLRVSWLELAGKPVAVEYQLAGGGVTYGYQSGLDPDYLDDDPGRLILIASIEQAIREGQRSFDLMRGDEPYKQHWRAEPRQTQRFRVVNAHATARLRDNLWRAADQLKAWLRPKPVVVAEASLNG